jgi:transcriptional regulator with XRE-family HTH domain
MQPLIGQVIRQIRQLRHLTQSDLAGDRFSKSYVSAVEHNRLAPSSSALRFFAAQLGQPDGNFAALLQQPEVVNVFSVADPLPPALLSNGKASQDESATLLEQLLEASAFPHVALDSPLPVLSEAQLAGLPPHVLTHYYMLLGKEARTHHDLSATLHAFETALQSAPAQQQAAILDDIGHTYLLMHAPFTALGYHLHARHLLSKEPLKRSSAALFLQIELHCADAYKALGAYPQARACYERARTTLDAHHDLATAGRVYAGLAYCTYAALFPAILSSALSLEVTPQHIERELQQALGLLLQSKSIYQVSGDHLQETNVRLLLISLLLDRCVWRRRMVVLSASDTEKKALLTECAALLNDAAEHGQSILLRWQKAHTCHDPLPTELDVVLFTTLSFLIRIAAERALLARLGENSLDAAYRQRAFAASLCQMVLDTLSAPTLPWTIVEQASTLSADTLTYSAPALPSLPDEPIRLLSPRGPVSQIEIYMAAGEVAEELGRAAPTSSYAQDCYAQATRFVQAALALAQPTQLQGVRDAGYRARLYQRWVALLEVRMQAAPALYEITSKVLFEVLTQSFWHLQHPPIAHEPQQAESNEE